MDLSARYLGFALSNPLVCGASPLGDDLDLVRRLEDAGAAAIVLGSWFEEQLEPMVAGAAAGSAARARDEYLERLRETKRAVGIPVVASLNGSSLGGWLVAARWLEEAGADALELNLYRVAANPAVGAQEIEEETVEIVGTVCDAVLLPVAVKLSPFYTALAHLAPRLEGAGADGLVIFNRFLQPDVDLEAFDVRPDLRLSDPQELLLRLRWAAILRGQLRGSLAVTGGVFRGLDVLKAIACGADAVQLVSALVRHGPRHLTTLLGEIERWLEAHELDALADLAGRLSLERCPDPEAFERAQYVWGLEEWSARGGRERESD